MSFELPAKNAVTGTAGYASVTWLQWFNLVHQTITAVRQSGPTASRPTKFVWLGRQYFDTTLGKPVYVKSVNPIVWADATGVAV